ncbi:MAG TPA: squalene/phytoene synthase family protein [Jatrophihabitantaceae bacterium]|jgi:squalene synthase HpnC
MTAELSRDAGLEKQSTVLEQVAAASAAQAGSENFPVALRVLPKGPRDKLMRAYSFARFVDDIGDEAPGDRLALLDAVDADVRALPSGTATLPVVQALRPLVDECGTPLAPFLDLIEANRIDQRVKKYDTFSELLHYCDYSAAPVGRIVLHIAGAATEANVSASDAVCNALQVLEHCQDVGEDARAGRIYIPGVELDDALAPTTGPAVRDAVATHVALSRGMLQSGRMLVRRLRGWPRLAIAGFVGGGLATAVALRRADYDVLAQAVKPGKGRTAREAARLWIGR